MAPARTIDGSAARIAPIDPLASGATPHEEEEADGEVERRDGEAHGQGALVRAQQAEHGPAHRRGAEREVEPALDRPLPARFAQ
ncbi:MAG: hypothetical protein M5U28_45590 [Sandaracinaceae bacterium]|nr:hypothetical protein [Sandaracinaceae bacterium]